MNALPENIPFQISNSDPVQAVQTADTIVIGQLGQTLDGCIATHSGDSKYINSQSGLKHLHKLRAAVDAVIVGVGSVNADDPSLTVRHCGGKQPVRVIIDPNERVDISSGLFHDNEAAVLIISKIGNVHPAVEQGLAEALCLSVGDHGFRPTAIVNALKGLGHKKILIEGGNNTLSRFLDAGVLDRLHLITAPMIMGAGLPGLKMSPIEKLSQALRPEVTLYPLGADIVFDCNFSGQRTNR
jgi:riboflavin-specific deaminase-like protein